MRRNKRVFAIAICLIMVMGFLAACGDSTPAAPDAGTSPAPGSSPAPPAATPPAGSTLPTTPEDETASFMQHIDIIGDSSQIAVINPFNPAANPMSSGWVLIMTHDRLIERDPESGQFIPHIAHDWGTDDFQNFVFNLRDDVYFHNGQQLTAEDVVFTIETAQDIGTGSPALAQWGGVESVRAVDNFTVEITLRDVNVDFYHHVSAPAACIVSKSALEADSETGTHIGSGAYTVHEFVSNDYVIFARNENYWNERFNVITPMVTIRYVPELTAAAARIERGESQLTFRIAVEDIPIFQREPDKFHVFPQLLNTVQGYSFNVSDPLLQDYNLRMAIMHATDRAAIALFSAGEWAVSVVGHERGGGTIWAYGTDFRKNDIPAIEYDLDLARQYLEQSNYNGETIEIAAAIMTNVRAAQALQEQLRVIGINTEVRELDSPGLSAYAIDPDGGSQIIIFSLQMNLAASSSRFVFVPGMPQNRMQYNNPEVTALLDAAGMELDVNARRDMYYRVQEIVAEDPPYLQLFWRLNTIIAAQGLGGVVTPADNLQNDFRQIFMLLD